MRSTRELSRDMKRGPPYAWERAPTTTSVSVRNSTTCIRPRERAVSASASEVVEAGPAMYKTSTR